MLNTMAMVGARFLLEGVLKGVQDHFNLAVAIRVNAGPASRLRAP
jgi:hypothetical protein